jgi:hypothetical protein
VTRETAPGGAIPNPTVHHNDHLQSNRAKATGDEARKVDKTREHLGYIGQMFGAIADGEVDPYLIAEQGLAETAAAADQLRDVT